MEFEIESHWVELIYDCSWDIIKALKGGIGGSVDIPLAYEVRARAMDLKKLRDDSRNIDIGVDDIVDRVTSGYGSDEGD